MAFQTAIMLTAISNIQALVVTVKFKKVNSGFSTSVSSQAK